MNMMALSLLHGSRAHRIMTLKTFHKNYHLYRKNQWLTIQQTYTRRMRYSDFILKRSVDKTVKSRLMDKTVKSRLMDKAVNSRLMDKTINSRLMDKTVNSRLMDKTVNSRLVDKTIISKLMDKTVNSRLMDKAVNSRLMDKTINSRLMDKTINSRLMDKTIISRLVDKTVNSRLMDKTINSRLMDMAVNSRLIHMNNCAEKKQSFTISTRFFSSMKDDEELKSWMKQINEDFEKGTKVVGHDDKSQKTAVFNSDDKSSSSEKSSSDEENVGKYVDELHTDLENDLEKLEKLGFTTEEVIDLLKRTNDLDVDSFEEDHESSDSDNAVENSRVTKGMHDKDGERANREKQGDGHNEKTGGSTNRMNEDWAVVTMKPEIKTDWSVVEIEDFVNIAEAEPDIEKAWTPPVDFVRGKTGVFDIDELVTVLRAANAQDLMTIRIPPELDFADYMVIVSGKSLRHMKAITADVKWIYKRKKSKSDKYLRVEGEKSDWYAMDLGNIVLHIFMPAARELYDLEMLWTVGAKFDPQCTDQQKDPYVFTVDDLPWLKELEQTSEDSESNDSQDERNQSK